MEKCWKIWATVWGWSIIISNTQQCTKSLYVGNEKGLGRCLLRFSLSLCWRSLLYSLALCEKQTHAFSNYFLKSPVTVATRPTCFVCHGGRPTQTFKLFKASSHIMGDCSWVEPDTYTDIAHRKNSELNDSIGSFRSPLIA